MPEEQHCPAAGPALCARGSWGLCPGPPDLSPWATLWPALRCVPCPVLLLCPGVCWGGSAGAQGTSGCPGIGGDFWVPSRAGHGGHIPGCTDFPHCSPLHTGAAGCWLCPPRATVRLLPKNGGMLGLPGQIIAAGPRLSIPACQDQRWEQGVTESAAAGGGREPAWHLAG